MKELALPITDPVLIFAILLFIILLTPLLLNRLRIPHLIGMIIAGAAVGPHGLNQKGAESLALKRQLGNDHHETGHEERILIPIGNSENAAELVNLSVTVKSRQSHSSLYALTVINQASSEELDEKKQAIQHRQRQRHRQQTQTPATTTA